MPKSPASRIGRKVRVFWDSEQAWFPGMIDDHNSTQGYHIQYFDGDDEWIVDLKDIVQFEDEDATTSSSGDLLSPNSRAQAKNEVDDDEEDNTELEILQSNYPEAKDDYRDITSAELEVLTSGVDQVPFTVDHGDGGRMEWEDEEDTDELLEALMRENDATLELTDTRFDDGDDGDGRKETDFFDGDQDGDQDGDRVDDDLPVNITVLRGTVFSVCDLPPVAVGETDGRVFFRVMYVESGETSTMFRCKTTIYKSDLANDLSNPVWLLKNKATSLEDLFRFEMLVPDSSLGVNGDILISVYRSRGQGGSDIIGQVCFSLQDIARKGTLMKSAHPGVEMRAISGSYPILDRNLRPMVTNSELDLRLSLSWRLPPESLMRQSVAPVRGAASTTPSKKSSQTKASLAKKSSAPKAPSRAEGHRKLKAKRIEWENAKMQERLNKHVTKAMVAAKAQQEQEAKLVEADKAARKAAKIARSSDNKLDSDAMKQIYNDYDKLLNYFTKLKSDVGAQQQRLTSLKANNTRITLSIKKNNLAIDRLKKLFPDGIASDRKRDNAFDQIAEVRSSLGKLLTVQSNGLPPPPPQPSSNLPDPETYEAQDHQLREMLPEYACVQQLRRGLVSRISIAKEKYQILQRAKAEEDEKMKRALLSAGGSDSIVPEGAILTAMLDAYNKQQQELAVLESRKINCFHLGPALSETQELEAMVAVLRERIVLETKKSEDLKSELIAVKGRVADLHGSKRLYRLRSALSYLYTVSSITKARENVNDLKQRGRDLEVEVSKYLNIYNKS